RSGGEHHRSGRRIHDQVLRGAGGGHGRQPAEPGLARRNRRGRRRAPDPGCGTHRDAGDRPRGVLRLEPHGGADAGGHAGHRHRPDAGGVRPIHRRRIRREYLLDRRLRADHFLDGRGVLHAVSGRQAAAGNQTDRRRSRQD
nr:hypothetical protein [Tanacetum cinerariifolium]